MKTRILIQDRRTKEKTGTSAYVVWGQNHLMQRRQFAFDGRHWYYQPTTRSPFILADGDIPDNVKIRMNAVLEEVSGRNPWCENSMKTMPKTAKLTSAANWNTYAGGLFAASDRYSYDVYTDIGLYKIGPVSSKYDVENHLGYMVHFCNTQGKLPGGLWQPLSKNLVNLTEARKLCDDHFRSNGGTAIQSPRRDNGRPLAK